VKILDAKCGHRDEPSVKRTTLVDGAKLRPRGHGPWRAWAPVGSGTASGREAEASSRTARFRWKSLCQPGRCAVKVAHCPLILTRFRDDESSNKAVRYTGMPIWPWSPQTQAPQEAPESLRVRPVFCSFTMVQHRALVGSGERYLITVERTRRCDTELFLGRFPPA
jgi:hypothetical protein